MGASHVISLLKFRTNFVPISFQLRTNFVPISLSCLTNLAPIVMQCRIAFEFRYNFFQISFQFRPMSYQFLSNFVAFRTNFVSISVPSLASQVRLSLRHLPSALAALAAVTKRPMCLMVVAFDIARPSAAVGNPGHGHTSVSCTKCVARRP